MSHPHVILITTRARVASEKVAYNTIERGRTNHCDHPVEIPAGICTNSAATSIFDESLKCSTLTMGSIIGAEPSRTPPAASASTSRASKAGDT
jgi:hypothetical protein